MEPEPKQHNARWHPTGDYRRHTVSVWTTRVGFFILAGPTELAPKSLISLRVVVERTAGFSIIEPLQGARVCSVSFYRRLRRPFIINIPLLAHERTQKSKKLAYTRGSRVRPPNLGIQGPLVTYFGPMNATTVGPLLLLHWAQVDSFSQQF